MEQYDLTISWKNSRKSSMVQWPINDWITFLAKGGGPKKKVSKLLEPYLFLYSRAIQGQLGGNLIDPALQGNVLLPEEFTECTNHILNTSGMHSIISGGLILGGKSQKGQTICVSHYNEPHGRRSK